MNTVPVSFTADFGHRIIICSDESFDIGSDDYISWHLLERACEASNLAFAQAGYTTLRVSGAYLRDEPRAFAYWATPREYVIACTRSMSETIRLALTDADFRSLLPAKSLALCKLHDDDITALAVSLVLATVLYHEVAHVVRFHLPYLEEQKKAQPELYPTLEGLCEADADKWSSYLIAPDLLAQAKGIREALKCSVPIEPVLRELLTFYGVALHVWFTFLNQTPPSKTTVYPHPLIRSTRITIGAADNIPTTTEMNVLAMDRSLSILDGLASVEKSVLRSEGAKQYPFDLAKEMSEINGRFEEIERILDPALLEVKTRWGSPH